MPVLSKAKVLKGGPKKTPAQSFRPDEEVRFKKTGVSVTIIYSNDDGTVAVKTTVGGVLYWKVEASLLERIEEKRIHNNGSWTPPVMRTAFKVGRSREFE